MIIKSIVFWTPLTLQLLIVMSTQVALVVWISVFDIWKIINTLETLITFFLKENISPKHFFSFINKSIPTHKPFWNYMYEKHFFWTNLPHANFEIRLHKLHSFFFYDLAWFFIYTFSPFFCMFEKESTPANKPWKNNINEIPTILCLSHPMLILTSDFSIPTFFFLT